MDISKWGKGREHLMEEKSLSQETPDSCKLYNQDWNIPLLCRRCIFHHEHILPGVDPSSLGWSANQALPRRLFLYFIFTFKLKSSTVSSRNPDSCASGTSTWMKVGISSTWFEVVRFCSHFLETEIYL